MTEPSDVNDTDKDESNNSIVHESFDKPLSENIFMDVSESECNIVNETLSQSNSSDVPTNVITESNCNYHIEPLASVKEASYFNIFECGRNLLDKLDVTYHVHSQHPKHRQQYQQDIINSLQHEKDIMICRRISLQKRMSEWTNIKFVRQYCM